MGLHPLFQDITDAHRGIHSHVDSLRPVAEPLGRALADLDWVVAKKAGKSVIQNLADMGGWTAPEEGTERYRMLDAALGCRGMPGKFLGGSGCHDMWSLVRDCASYATQRDAMDLTRTVPGWGGVSEDSAEMAFLQWGLSPLKRLSYAEPGDVLLFADGRGIMPAILTAPGGNLDWSLPVGHKSEAKMIRCEQYVAECYVGPFWMDRLVSAYSFDQPGSPIRAIKAVAA